MLFRGSQEECKELVDWLNSLMPGIVKFKFDYSHSRIEFLDLQIFIEDGQLKTNLHIKPGNLQLYLDFFSNHPAPCKEAIIYSQALRIIERCSLSKDVTSNLENLKEKLKDRNYPEILINKKFEEARKKDRKELIYQGRKKKKYDDKIRLIFTHNEGNPPIHQWLRESKKLLVRNEKAKKLGNRIQVGFKQPKNLKCLVSGIKNKENNIPPEDPGCMKCGKPCVSCPVLKEGKTFCSTNTKKVYRIQHTLDCNSDFVVYLGTCKKCKGQYVGKTTRKFRLRHSGHKQEIKKKYGGLGNHFGGEEGCGYLNVSIQIIDQVEGGNHLALSECELYWQNQLRCYVENGGNAHCYRKEM